MGTSPRGQSRRRDFLEGALVGLAGGSLLSLPARPALADSQPEAAIKALAPGDAPAADVGYSPGILAEGQRLVIVSGQGPKDLDAEMEMQIRQTFERIGLVLEEAGASFRNVVLIRSYFVHLSRDLPVFRKVRLDYLVPPFPASTAVGVTELAIPGLEVEIEAVAVI